MPDMGKNVLPHGVPEKMEGKYENKGQKTKLHKINFYYLGS